MRCPTPESRGSSHLPRSAVQQAAFHLATKKFVDIIQVLQPNPSVSRRGRARQAELFRNPRRGRPEHRSATRKTPLQGRTRMYLHVRRWGMDPRSPERISRRTFAPEWFPGWNRPDIRVARSLRWMRHGRPTASGWNRGIRKKCYSPVRPRSLPGRGNAGHPAKNAATGAPFRDETCSAPLPAAACRHPLRHGPGGLCCYRTE